MMFLGSDISPLTLSVENVDMNILRVKLGANGRFEVPQSLFQNTGQGDLPSKCTLCAVQTLSLMSQACSIQRQSANAAGQQGQDIDTLCLQAGSRGIQSMGCSTAHRPLGLQSRGQAQAQQRCSTQLATVLYSRYTLQPARAPAECIAGSPCFACESCMRQPFPGQRLGWLGKLNTKHPHHWQTCP